MIGKSAETLYTKSILLKQFNRRNLLLRRKRAALIDHLGAMQALAASILSGLPAEESFSPERFELALFMERTLFECVSLASAKDRNWRETLCRTTWGFHNLPRAFLPEDHPFRTDVQHAREYFDAYTKRR